MVRPEEQAGLQDFIKVEGIRPASARDRAEITLTEAAGMMFVFCLLWLLSIYSFVEEYLFLGVGRLHDQAAREMNEVVFSSSCLEL